MNVKYLIYEAINNKYGREARLLAVHCENQNYDLYNLNRIHKKDLSKIITLNDEVFKLEKRIDSLEHIIITLVNAYKDYKSPEEFQAAINRHVEEQSELNKMMTEVMRMCNNE